MNVYRLKYIAVIVSGALAGLGGVFLVFIVGASTTRARPAAAASSASPR